MFGFGKKKSPAPPPSEKRQRTSAGKEDFKNDLAKLGLLDFGLDDNSDNDGSLSDVSDGDLEQELLAIVGENAGSTDELIPERKSLPPPLVPVPVTKPVVDSAENSTLRNAATINNATSEQVPVEDIFNAPPPPETVLDALQQRLEKYKTEVDKANETSNSSKARRMARIVKQYEDAISAHKRGRPVVFDDLPTPPGFGPIPITNSAVQQSSPKFEPLPSFQPDPETFQPKGKINIPTFPEDNEIPPAITTNELPTLTTPERSPSRTPITESVQVPVVPPSVEGTELPPETDVDIFNAPPQPRTVMEALQQRLEKYKSEVTKANESNNGSKARRMGRIVKQYEDAIVAHKKGRVIPIDELPTPPGFAPIPIANTTTPAPAVVPTPQPKPTVGDRSPKQGPSPAAAQPAGPSAAGQPTGPNPAGTQKPIKGTLQQKQLQLLLHRQKLFKDAALNAKQRGDIEQAKAFLKTSKGFDTLIEASRGGLPVDMATLPSPPEEVASLILETSNDFEVIGASDCLPPPEGSTAEIFTKLEHDLREQLKMCMKTREHFKTMGDVASANRFEKLAIDTKKDLDALRTSMKLNGDIPKFHYETRIFSITECNSDLADDEIEISILKGINYKVPNPTEVDTYIKVDLPYPSAEETQTQKTAVIRDTNNPDYDTIFKMKINRTARPFHRFVHRHGVKLELWSKGYAC